MKLRISAFSLMLVMLFFANNTHAQKIEDLLAKYTDANGEKFMQPLADVFGANVNSGLFTSPVIKKNGFQLYIGLVGMYAPIGDNKKYFMGVPEDENFSQVPVKTPSIFGPVDGTKVPNDNGTVYQFPGGLDVAYMPFAMPQITVGSLFGTDFTARFFAYDAGEDIGKIDVLGFGVRHSISQYIKLPVHLSVGAYYQTFKLGDYIDATNTLFNVQAGYTVSVLNVYGALGYEQSSFKLDVDIDNETHLAFDMTGGNSVRFTLGASVDLGGVRLHVDYNLADQQTISGGLGIAIGGREKKKAPETAPEGAQPK